jgi:hypothetical protein
MLAKNAAPQTQRNSNAHASAGAMAVQSSTGRSSIRGGQTAKSGANYHQALFTASQPTSQAPGQPKQHISNVTARLISEHHDRINDKENKQRLSNKAPSISQGKATDSTNALKRTKTAHEGMQRQSIVSHQASKDTLKLKKTQSVVSVSGQKNGTKSQAIQPQKPNDNNSSSNHEKSKNSEGDMNMHHSSHQSNTISQHAANGGYSHMQSTSQTKQNGSSSRHNNITNRSTKAA